MAVTIRTGAALKSLLGGETEASADGATVGELLDALGIRDRMCDAEGNIRRHFNIHVNDDEDVRLGGGLDSPVSDGDTVTILSAIAGGQAFERKVWLTFPRDMIEKPMIWEVSQKYKVVTNIRQASVTKDIGLVGLCLSGEESEVRKAIDYFIDAGVSVEPIEIDVVE